MWSKLSHMVYTQFYTFCIDALSFLYNQEEFHI